MHFKITSKTIAVSELANTLQHERAGACATFEGWVRNHNEGQAVASLEYEAYAELAETEGNRILDEAREKFDLLAAEAVHRVGHLQIGDMAVWVGVASAHRGPAFDACRFIIDELKARVPIWKKEHYVAGESTWINCATKGEFSTDDAGPSS
ncbi:MAG: molybdenum cofactor biosynthesis protein MoaE [Opitutaceae bacterium]|nr:molybdenum cofactor biosynthesis protein MoaE [Opitutaceae bacterium]